MLKDKKEPTKLSDLGEFALIEYLTKNIKLKNKSSKYGVGDDAAVVKTTKTQVVTTDILTEGIHFDFTYTPAKHLGYKSAVVNFSDVYAMNAMPKQMLVSIAVSSKISLELINDFYEGLYLACDRYGVDLVGGDTTSSLTGMTVSITVIGEADAKDIVYRNGAKETDVICVTGDLGGAYMGLQLLEREKQVFEEVGAQPDFSGKDYILERFLKPEARQDIIELLKEIGVKPTSMIDISDGLASEMHHICKQSEVGCKIYIGKIPIDYVTAEVADSLKLEPLIPALNGGEDYELLFTISVKDFEKIKEYSQIKVIGHIMDKDQGLNLITEDDNFIELKAHGRNNME